MYFSLAAGSTEVLILPLFEEPLQPEDTAAEAILTNGLTLPPVKRSPMPPEDDELPVPPPRSPERPVPPFFSPLSCTLCSFWPSHCG